MASSAPPHLISVCMVGAGEYNCGYIPRKDAAPDKKAGVVACVLLDLKRLGKVGRILLTDALKERPTAAAAVMREKIQKEFKSMDVDSIELFPRADDASAPAFDPAAYRAAFATLRPGDAVIVFTPDDTHGPIALHAMSLGLHVLVAKPVVKTLKDHLALVSAAKEAGVLCCVEYHKRWDPIYSDAVQRMRSLGPFSYFQSTMTQRKEQLDTFAGWAGRSSDISYYLNSHHIDVHAWAMSGRGRPVRVTAASSTGVANARLGRDPVKDGVEDTITLLVAWENAAAPRSREEAGAAAEEGAAAAAAAPNTTGHAVYMASWSAPTADCHTQQYFHFMAHGGEIRVDQAHRGYTQSADTGTGAAGGTGALQALNPLYMRYVPSAGGYFAGQSGYGYKSIAEFVEAAAEVQRGALTAADVEAAGSLATVEATLPVTAILEAGRRSLDRGGAPVRIVYGGGAAGAAPGGDDDEFFALSGLD